MGRKKEKRPAGYGRRMKLDLWNQEPESKEDETGLEGERENEINHTNANELVSAEERETGSQVANPLSLLGQYSDEHEENEGKEEKTQGLVISGKEAITEKIDDQVFDFISELQSSGLLKDEEGETNSNSGNIPCGKPTTSEPSTKTKAEIASKKDDSIGAVANDESHDISRVNQHPAVGDEWTTVFDKSSNSYYYWNTQTGETSWEVPEKITIQSQANQNQMEHGSLKVDVNELQGVEGELSEGKEEMAKESAVEEVGGEKNGSQGIVQEEKRDIATENERRLELESILQVPKAGNSVVDPSVEIQTLKNLLSIIKQLSNISFDEIPVLTRLAIEIKLRISDFEYISSQQLEYENFFSHLKKDVARIDSEFNKCKEMVTFDKSVALETEVENIPVEKSSISQIRASKSTVQEKMSILSNGFKEEKVETMDTEYNDQKELRENEDKGGKGKNIEKEKVKMEDLEEREEVKVKTWRVLRKPSHLTEALDSRDREKDKEIEKDRDKEKIENGKEEKASILIGKEKLDASSTTNHDTAEKSSDKKEPTDSISGFVETLHKDSIRSTSETNVVCSTESELQTRMEFKEVTSEKLLDNGKEMEVELEDGEVAMDIDDSDGENAVFAYQPIVSAHYTTVSHPSSYITPPVEPLGPIPVPPPPPSEEEFCPPLPPEPYATDYTHPNYSSFYQPSLVTPSYLSSTASTTASLYHTEESLFPLHESFGNLHASVYASQTNMPVVLSTSSDLFPYASLQTSYSDSLPMSESSNLSSQFIPSSFSSTVSTASSSIGPPSIYSAPSSLSLKSQFSSFIEKETENFRPLESSSITYTSELSTSSSSSSSSSSFLSSSVPSLSTSGPSASSKMDKGKPSKKRSQSEKKTRTLKVNKKLSKLVDKWKAVKEELYEEDEDEKEEEPMDIETLERKKLKEIEDWKLSQIRSGEADENANFQPLSVDWRERIKKRKVKSKSSSEIVDDEKESSPATAAANVCETNENVSKPSKNSHPDRKPDLDLISKNLPSGWQAFWDPSSKKVYYGNLSTKETSWDKPT